MRCSEDAVFVSRRTGGGSTRAEVVRRSHSCLESDWTTTSSSSWAMHTWAWTTALRVLISNGNSVVLLTCENVYVLWPIKCIYRWDVTPIDQKRPENRSRVEHTAHQNSGKHTDTLIHVCVAKSDHERTHNTHTHSLTASSPVWANLNLAEHFSSDSTDTSHTRGDWTENQALLWRSLPSAPVWPFTPFVALQSHRSDEQLRRVPENLQLPRVITYEPRCSVVPGVVTSGVPIWA